jgi:hypothetical protein
LDPDAPHYGDDDSDDDSEEARGDTASTMAHIYDIGTRAWQPDAAEGWVASEVTDKQIAGDKVKLVFTLENGEVGAPTMPQVVREMRSKGRLTKFAADQNRRNHAGRHPGRRRREPAASDEPGYARS